MSLLGFDIESKLENFRKKEIERLDEKLKRAKEYENKPIFSPFENQEISINEVNEIIYLINDEINDIIYFLENDFDYETYMEEKSEIKIHINLIENYNHATLNYIIQKTHDINFFHSDYFENERYENLETIIGDNKRNFLVRCNGCSTPISNKLSLLSLDKELKDQLDDLEVLALCCRKNFLCPILYPSKNYKMENFEAPENLKLYENNNKEILRNFPLNEYYNNEEEKEKFMQEYEKKQKDLENYLKAGVEVPLVKFEDLIPTNLSSFYTGGEKYTIKINKFTI